jgi:hypothetical protein
VGAGGCKGAPRLLESVAIKWPVTLVSWIGAGPPPASLDQCSRYGMIINEILPNRSGEISISNGHCHMDHSHWCATPRSWHPRDRNTAAPPRLAAVANYLSALA